MPKQINLPDANASEAEWAAFWTEVGRPLSPDGYEYSPPSGHQLDANMLNRFRAAAFKAGISRGQWQAIIGAFNAQLAEVSQAIAAERAALPTARDQALKTKWGQAYETKRKAFDAWLEANPGLKAALEKSGALFDAETFVALEPMAASASREDGLGPSGSGGRTTAGITPDEARKALDAEMMKADFSKALYDARHPGHAAAVARRAELYEAMHGEQGTLTPLAREMEVSTKPTVNVAGLPVAGAAGAQGGTTE